MKRLEDLDAAQAYYGRKYTRHLLPPLRKVMKNGSGLSIGERNQVIRWVADGSLAVVSSGTSWSNALGSRLLQSFRSRHQQQHQQTNVGKMMHSGRLRFRKSVLRSSSRHSCVSRKGRISLHRNLQRNRQNGVVQARIEALQDLVPGGNQIRSSLLLMEEAVDYMRFLEVQVGVLQALATAVDDDAAAAAAASNSPS